MVLKCISIDQSGVTWPETRGGSEVRRDCPGALRGFARWRCTKSGQWALSGPDLSDCVPYNDDSSLVKEKIPSEISEKFKETDLTGVLRNLETEIGKQDNEANIVQLVENVSRKLVNTNINLLKDQNFHKVALMIRIII